MFINMCVAHALRQTRLLLRGDDAEDGFAKNADETRIEITTRARARVLSRHNSRAIHNICVSAFGVCSLFQMAFNVCAIVSQLREFMPHNNAICTRRSGMEFII